ncbi:MAG: LptF/LptG family permease, partial [Alphaproteobacteria bacterium]
MRCCTRYIFRQTFWPLVFVTVTMAGVVWLTQSLNFLDLVINRNLPVGIFLSLSILALPMMMSVLLPIAMFAAVTFTFTKLTIDSELVILRASGISQPALARPALALAGLVTLLCYALTLYLMPLAHRNFRDLKFAIRGNYSYIMLREGVFNTIMDGLTVYVRARDSNGELLGILVHDSRTPG